ncbi:Protein byr4 [Ceratocystis platani]|uniref:Protein byr4 n=1 Tax=Ceratocystis fimbriata f. sp. platani TaxID=88771 RepID=A0A0F8B8I1_CERFI|nr:Protein byr4 [Ceratocystis platani]
MESLRLKQREPVVADADIENWDDDDFLLDDDISFHTTQSGRQSAGPAMPRSPSSTSNRRDSHSSHISFRSERESLNGEERHVFLPEDERSTLDAIKAAANLGIPLPQNIPPSALMGGSINRLGGRKGKKVSQDGWEVDLEFPESSQALSLKQQDSSKFPETLRQVSGSSLNSMVSDSNSTPLKMPPDLDTSRSPRRSPVPSTRAEPAPINLDRFRDDDDDGFFGGDTIKVTKRQQRKPLSLITPATSLQNISSLAPAAAPPPATADDDFEADLQLPSDCKLSLRKGRDIPGLAPHNDDLDWGDGSGSLGTRYGGTKREQRSARSSSASALSPSVASSMTVESEDDTFDGLVLPPGLLNLDDRLKGLGDRRKSNSPDPKLEEPAPSPWASVQTPSTDHEDLLDGLEFGDGAIDAHSRPTSRNISRTGTRSPSPRRYRAHEKATLDSSWRQFNKPKTRHFGDGHELDAFDDLPTSATIEAKFVKAPVTSGPKAALRDQDGMCYNPDTYRWEGNDTALAAFEPPPAAPSPLAVTIPQMVVRDKEISTPRPALITNISAIKGIQVVGGMVFDPQNMCWLKISQRQNQRGARSRHSNSNLYSAAGSQSDALDSIDGDQDSDEDPFKDIPDLMDNSADSGELTPGGGRTSDAKDEWMVGEEFDVGPEFVRRQREEEERWRKKCERWLAASSGRRDKESWRWTLRDLVVGDYH